MRNTVKDNFETVYLRQNMCKKIFHKNEEIHKLLSSKVFLKCVKYITTKTYKQHKNVLLKAGFDFEDLHQVVTVFGLQFINYYDTNNDLAKDYKIFLKYLSNQLSNFFIHIERKFRFSEKIEEIHINNLEHIEAISSEEVPDLRPVKGKYTRLMPLVKMDIERYTGRLSDLATSKFVDYEVRKKARFLCKKHQINYIEWAENQIKDFKLTPNDFILR